MGTESQGVDYTAVLADLEARKADLESQKAQIEAAIAVITALVNGGLPPPVNVAAPAAAAAPPSNGNANVEIQSDTFFGLSILDAAKKYMGMRKRPSSAGEIV